MERGILRLRLAAYNDVHLEEGIKDVDLVGLEIYLAERMKLDDL